MKKTLSQLAAAFLALFMCNSVLAQTTPNWVIPLYFEDGSGARDTFRIGYQVGLYAGSNWDSPLEQSTLVPIDTAHFQVYWGSIPAFEPTTLLIREDSVHKMDLMGFDGLANNYRFETYIAFHKARYPITLKWGAPLLDDPNLPFPDNLNHPRARMALFGNIQFGYTSYCSNQIISAPDYLTNDVAGILALPSFQGGPYPDGCVHQDSFIINSDPLLTHGGEYFRFAIEKYDAPLYSPIGVNEIDDSKYYAQYPNPVSDIYYIENKSTETAQYTLMAYNGYILASGTLQAGINTFDAATLPEGCYILRIQDNEKQYTKKLLNQLLSSSKSE